MRCSTPTRWFIEIIFEENSSGDTDINRMLLYKLNWWTAADVALKQYGSPLLWSRSWDEGRLEWEKLWINICAMDFFPSSSGRPSSQVSVCLPFVLNDFPIYSRFTALDCGLVRFTLQLEIASWMAFVGVGVGFMRKYWRAICRKRNEKSDFQWHLQRLRLFSEHQQNWMTLCFFEIYRP